MDERELREIFLERLHIELHLFRDSMLRRSKSDIYISCYMIDIYITLYEILAEKAEHMKEPLLRMLLYQRSGILDTFYQEWLSRDDSIYKELQDYVEGELGGFRMSDLYDLYKREDDSDGKEHDKAA